MPGVSEWLDRSCDSTIPAEQTTKPDLDPECRSSLGQLTHALHCSSVSVPVIDSVTCCVEGPLLSAHQPTLREGRVGDQSDAEVVARCLHPVLLRLSVQQVVVHLRWVEGTPHRRKSRWKTTTKNGVCFPCTGHCPVGSGALCSAIDW